MEIKFKTRDSQQISYAYIDDVVLAFYHEMLIGFISASDSAYYDLSPIPPTVPVPPDLIFCSKLHIERIIGFLGLGGAKKAPLGELNRLAFAALTKGKPMSNKKYDDEIYFMQDPVTEDISSVGIGECWLYFYKETLIGARHITTNVSYFIDAKTTKDTKAPVAPTLQHCTNEHIQEAIDERDQSQETCHRVAFSEIFGHAMRILLMETNDLVDDILMGRTS